MSPSILRGPQVEIAPTDTVHGVFLAHAALRPQDEALRWLDRGTVVRRTYAEVERSARVLAGYLISQGARPGGTIAVCIERGPDLIIAFLAAMMTGSAYLPLDPSHPPKHLRFMLEDASAGILLSRPVWWPDLPDGVTLIDVEATPMVEVLDVPVVGGRDDLAYVMYTSGSTGKPKGAEITHAGILRLVRSPFIAWSGHTFLHHSASTFDLATFEIWGPLLNGGVCAVAEPGPLSLDDFHRHLTALEISTLWLTAGLFHTIVAHRVAMLGSLSQLLAGGDALSPTHVETVLATHPELLVVDGYGPTEVTTFISCHRMRGPARFPEGVPIGTPIANTDVAIIDDHGAVIADGGQGELVAAGDGVARGYRNRPELTRERFTSIDLPGLGPTRVYRTGDQARIRPDGTLAFCGRRDHQVKIRGFRVELDEIEQVLRSHPLVGDAAVVYRRKEEVDGVIDAYLALRWEDLRGEAALGAVHQDRWTSVYEATYSQVPADPLFHVTGWNSSYDDMPLPHDQLRELIEGTTARIRGLKPTRLLELGCGTGLLLLRLLPGLERCVASDPAPTGLAHISQVVGADARYAGKEPDLRIATADADLGMAAGAFDVAMVNSVVQCFPDESYLRQVITDRMLALVADGGSLFMGDCRNLRIQAAFHASIAAHRADPDLKGHQILWRIRSAQALESQLLVDPRYYPMLGHHLGGLDVRVLLKRGRSSNEMLAFRYDAILTRRSPRTPPDLTIPSTTGTPREQLLRAVGRRAVITGIPNARVSRWVQLAKAVEQRLDDRWGDIQAEIHGLGDQPEDWHEAAEALGMDIELSWASGRPDGSFDAIVAPKGTDLPAAPIDPEASPPWVNDPLASQKAEAAIGQVRTWFRDQVPAYLMPRTFQAVETLPLNASGKVDRRALPDPGLRLQHAAPAPPANPLERDLVALWEDVLSVAPIGVDERFFDLGGTSLTAVAMLERLAQQNGFTVPLGGFLKSQSIRGLAQLCRGESSQDSSRLIRIKPVGKRRTLFSICEYYDIARHLPKERPYVVLDFRYAEKVADPQLTIAAVAERALVSVRKHQESGPYLLAGHSYGTAVAWQMARMLEDAGQRVLGVVLFDPPVLTSLGAGRREAARWFYHVRRILTSSPDEAVKRLKRALANTQERFRQGNDDDIFADFRFTAIAAPVLVAYPKDSYLRMHPDRDPRRALQALCGGLTEIDADGDHFTLLREPHVAGLARSVSQWLERVDPTTITP